MSQIASDAKISSAMAALGMTAPLPNLDDSQVLKAILVALGNITSGGGGGGTGDVVGPASSTNGAVALWNGTTGKLLQDSSVLITGRGTIALGGFTLTVPTSGTAALLGVANAFTVNGAASTPAMSITGSVFTGGSASTTQPLFLIQPTGTSWTNGNINGTAFGINLASGSTADLIHGQINNSTFFKATSGGQFWLSSQPALVGNGGNTIIYGGGNPIMVFHGANANMGGSQITWGTNAFGNVSDVGVNRLAAGILKVTDGGSGYGIVDASAYRVGGTPGFDFSGAVTNITVVKGIITAAS